MNLIFRGLKKERKMDKEKVNLQKENDFKVK